MRKEFLKDAKKIVIKIGTSTLTNENGSLNESLIKNIVADICKLCDDNKQIIIVTSGAVGAGMGILNISQKPKNINQKQALAAVGQVALMHLYERIFWAYSKNIAQILLTRGDFEDRKRYLNARNVCAALLEKNIIPIINENDTVVADELKVGDNDTLSALVTGLIDADLLIILSDIDGLYDKNPNLYKDAKIINLVKNIDENIEKMAGDEGSKFGTGGMKTKIKSAKMTSQIGTNLIIANGKKDNVLLNVLKDSNEGTLFLANDKKVSLKKHWLAYGAKNKGEIVIDNGAKLALKSGKSLLAVGVLDVVGDFCRGEIVEILNNKEIIARGISNYSSKQILLIKGKKSDEIEQILAYKYEDDIMHADNIVLDKG
ncbi:glutamate 5-kinase [Campylobacter pinnipediorum]|uniref:glutamate 5-kinase n=1 Tax=Campylobacter pinnipediorum TaxID=1965231 RepID=UPI00084D3B07|nr:glutamate 5-kinase [Campylobacter pinnipediorum]AQW81582.1 gamma-glutamyl kinase [Campylobacter pinnipediorum subsp. pinnipediorum]AQW84778.1 gamma-glutamyl kinase [Campylobacter pinnipediorum subsp. pinnipediorum]